MRVDRYLPKFHAPKFRVPAFLKRHAPQGANVDARPETKPDATSKKYENKSIYLKEKISERFRKWLRPNSQAGKPNKASRAKSPESEETISYMSSSSSSISYMRSFSSTSSDNSLALMDTTASAVGTVSYMNSESSADSDGIAPLSGITAAHPNSSLPRTPGPEFPLVLTNNIHWEENTGPVNPECALSFLDMKLETANIATGHFGSVSIFSNKDGKKFIGKTSRNRMFHKNGEIKDDLAVELNAYKTLYQAKNVDRHPNLVNAYGIATIPTAYGPMRTLLMDHIPGPTGTKMFDDLRTAWNSGAISSSEYHSAIQFIGRKLMEVAQHLSMAGIVHNDIKPDNFLVNETTGEPVLIDLGLWKTKGARGTGGTRAFKSPEAKDGKPVDELSDLFTVGATLVAGIEGAVRYSANERIYYDKKRFPYNTGNNFDLAPSSGLQFQKEIINRNKNNQVIRQPGSHAIDSAYSKAMTSLLEVDATRRARLSDIKDIPFFNDSILDDIESKQVITKVIRLSYTSTSTTEITRIAKTQERLSNLTNNFNPANFKELQDISVNDAALADILSMEFPSQSQIEKERNLHTEMNKMIVRSKQWLDIAEQMAQEINSLTIKSDLDENGIKIKTNIKPDTQEPDVLQANLIAFRANLADSISRNFGARLSITDLEAHLAEANTLLLAVAGLRTNNASLSYRINDFSKVVFKMRQLIAVHEESRIKVTVNTPKTIKESDYQELHDFLKKRMSES